MLPYIVQDILYIKSVGEEELQNIQSAKKSNFSCSVRMDSNNRGSATGRWKQMSTRIINQWLRNRCPALLLLGTEESLSEDICTLRENGKEEILHGLRNS